MIENIDEMKNITSLENNESKRNIEEMEKNDEMIEDSKHSDVDAELEKKLYQQMQIVPRKQY